MKMKTLSARQLRQAKFLLRVPILAIPLLTLLFWISGGGRSQALPVARGFDMFLPPAHVRPIVRLDKTGYYALAQRDSAAARQKARMEASYARVLGLDSARSPDSIAHAVQVKLEAVKRTLAGHAVAVVHLPVQPTARPAAPSATQSAADPDRLIHRPLPPTTNLDRPLHPPLPPAPNLDRLEKAMSALQHDDAGNAELSSLTAVVEKLAALQTPRHDSVQHHPDQSPRRSTLTVKALPDPDDTLGANGPVSANEALGPYDTLCRFDSSAIEAIVPEEQVLVSGGELKLELTRDILLAGQRIPSGTPVYGIASLSGERLRVTIDAISWQGRVFPVQLQVDDEDGLTGIYIPGAPLTDAARESASSEIGAVGPTVVSTGLAGQAANAGMTLARSLIGKKVRPVRVTVPAGYHVLLHPKNDGL
ncbi:MAG TPA: conjugative transposon protein TraM [Puia sp.]|nr:conjugative transposon protein TraM [Puia sp.]